MKVLFLPKHEYLGASSRYRTLQYLPYIKKQDIDFDVSPLFSDKYLKYKYKYKKENKLITLQRILNRIKIILINANRYDLLVIEKELLPYFPPFLELFLKINNIKYIVDYDDAVWHNYDKHKKWFIKSLLKNKISYVMKNACTVIVGSEYIATYAKKCNSKKIVKIPTVIDSSKYRCDKSEPKEEKFVIGWIGSPSSSQYILEINEILTNFTKKYNAIIHLVGFDRNLENKLNFKKKIIEWKEDSEVNEICKFDVGIMPLSDTPFARGKCGFKLIQYMGCKKPVIASAIGENSVIVDNAIDGYLVYEKSQWSKYLELVYHNKSRIQMGLKGNQKIMSKYSLKVNQIKYIETILGSRDR